jgi:hypothetical protein
MQRAVQRRKDKIELFFKRSLHTPKKKLNKAIVICERSNVGDSVNEANIKALLF